VGVEPSRQSSPTAPIPPPCGSLPPRPPFNPHPNLPPARGKGPEGGEPLNLGDLVAPLRVPLPGQRGGQAPLLPPPGRGRTGVGVEPSRQSSPTAPIPPPCGSLPPRPPFNPHPNLPPARGKGPEGGEPLISVIWSPLCAFLSPGSGEARPLFSLPRAGGGPGWGSNLAPIAARQPPHRRPADLCLRARPSTPILTFPLPGGRDRTVVNPWPRWSRRPSMHSSPRAGGRSGGGWNPEVLLWNRPKA
jgi:protein transport protein SEC31